MTTRSAREAATAHLQHAEVAINTMFDRQDDVEATLAQIAQIAASDGNVFARSQALADKATALAAQVEVLRAAAVDASAHRSKRDLAKDLSASPNAVFATASSDAPSANASVESPTVAA
jgi:hypothetical protein